MNLKELHNYQSNLNEKLFKESYDREVAKNFKKKGSELSKLIKSQESIQDKTSNTYISISSQIEALMKKILFKVIE